MTERVLDDMERMLDFCAHARLQMLQFFRHAGEVIVGQSPAFRTFHGHVFGDRFANILSTFFHVLIASVNKRCGLVAVQQRVRLRHIGNIPSCTNNSVHQTARSIDTDVRYRAEVSVVAFLRLMHLRVALAIFVFRRRQCGIDDGPFAHFKPFSARCPLIVSKI